MCPSAVHPVRFDQHKKIAAHEGPQIGNARSVNFLRRRYRRKPASQDPTCVGSMNTTR
ncbi:hypothetical protein CBM2623_B20137 [Cupriavidus taiwanensis]|nr:hypothetical protein CBM2608_B20138 [Cupriavidus taiwanensis]SPA34225.1 hypothetical protein CBM2623_B20137 [Cupriavidus taiwanensis]SPA52057.1 hypothetical protein CBM2629_B20136 [Cupriavidus taiwanensis]